MAEITSLQGLQVFLAISTSGSRPTCVWQWSGSNWGNWGAERGLILVRLRSAKHVPTVPKHTKYAYLQLALE